MISDTISDKAHISIRLRLFGLLLIVIGLPLAAGGGYLLYLGGSWRDWG
ncbi:MAG: hypothetical protein ACK5LJ_14320 [Paracoccus sp. (in: a-proteobacteria)]